ncbi:helix-turn-helix domain-containing protein [Streptomyces diastaticus]|uniref:helix-turn-helix domain-containing protein n=1 Tax=Streptomyces diastaticus TaxID=1956 RepID=UPI003F4DAA07
MRAVAALVAGRDREDVAAVFGVSLKAVDGWWAKWLAGGPGALVMRPRGQAGRAASGEKGRTPEVRRSGNRFSVNAMSAISTKAPPHPDAVELHFCLRTRPS